MMERRLECPVHIVTIYDASYIRSQPDGLVPVEDELTETVLRVPNGGIPVVLDTIAESEDEVLFHQEL